MKPRALYTFPEPATFGSAAVGAAVILALVYSGQPMLLVLAGLLPVAVAISLRVAQHRLALFVTVLVLFALQARFTPEVTPLEIVFLVVLLAYAAQWVLGVVYDRSYSSGTDYLGIGVGILMVYAIASALLGIVSGHSAGAVASELFNFFILFLYFPTRNLVRDDRNALTVIVVLVAFFGASAATRNLFEFATKLDNAVYLWQLMLGRVAKNEMLLYAGCVFSVGSVLWFEARWARALALVSAALCMGGLLITQFRAYYIVVIIALGLLTMLVERPERRRLLRLYGMLLLLLAVILVVALGPHLLAVATGLLNRVSSIGDAGTRDLSILSRLLETRVVLDYIQQSPLVGHGLGFEFGFFDPSYRYTWMKTYAHNTYLSIVMKMGVAGLLLMLWGWVGAIVRTIKTARRSNEARTRMLAALITATLAPLLVSALTSASFSTPDVFVLHAVLWGAAAGLWQRT